MIINKERLFRHLLELGKIGEKENSGITRLSFTKEEKAAKELVGSYMKQAGLGVWEDAVGNLIGRKDGMDLEAATILIGSHLDSVTEGGKFDGALGVIAGIEVLQRMNEQGIKTIHPIEVIGFTDEEGARFGYGMLGSRGIMGTLKIEALQHFDQAGISIAQAMEQVGLEPEKIYNAARKSESIKAYIELHIEQGKVLENQNLPVGIVSGIAGPLWLKVTLRGESGHAGSTPMNMRKDPVIAAAKIISYIDSETRKYANAVATIGKITVSPGGINVIPGQIEFTLDLRDIDETIRDNIENNIKAYAEKICNKNNIELDFTVLQRVAPCPCSQEISGIIEEACRLAGLHSTYLSSGAGHDGMQFKDFCPIGMIFVRSERGVSHRADEWSSENDCGAGTEVLYHTILKLDKRV
ncbi:MAG: hydantoinase/carbamoylase family amidase [Ruminiclostridium sp.]